MKALFMSFVVIALAAAGLPVYIPSNAASDQNVLSEVTVRPIVPAIPDIVDTNEVTSYTLLLELNERRQAAGVDPVQLDERLNKSAQAKCDDMFTHKYYDHVEPFSGQHGYELAREYLDNVSGSFAENLNSRLSPAVTPQAIFDSWFTSEPHKKAALSTEYTMTGFGFCKTSVNVPSQNYKTVVEHFYGPAQ